MDFLKTENVFLFVPNIIGYFRIVALFVSFYYMPRNPWRCTFWFLFIGLLDTFDGPAARALNQGSRFGELLDMLTDRCGTMCLMGALCYYYPKYILFFQFSMFVDITSHWFHFYGSLMKGSTSHKQLDLSANPILRHYYHNTYILTTMCIANDWFYSMLYLTHFTPGPMLLSLYMYMTWYCRGGWGNVRIGWFSIGLCNLMLYLTCPLSFIKIGISIVQFYAACHGIAAIDIEERQYAKTK